MGFQNSLKKHRTKRIEAFSLRHQCRGYNARIKDFDSTKEIVLLDGITHYTATRIHALRKRAQRVSDGVRFSNALDGWFYRGDEPMKLLRLFTELRLKDGYILHGCRYVTHGNGNGLVCATREENCNSDLLPIMNGELAPLPISIEAFESIDGTLSDFMEAIEGDGSPWSYFSASILARELQEYGALWHGASWSTCTILDVAPWELTASKVDASHMDSPSPRESWTWTQDEPVDWRPRVEFIHGRPRVTFYAYSALGGERISKFIDTYPPDAYTFESEEIEIADGSVGYVF